MFQNGRHNSVTKRSCVLIMLSGWSDHSGAPISPCPDRRAKPHPPKGIILHLKKLLCVGLAAFGLTGTAAVATASANITEAGSSLAYPLWSIWASHYSGISVNAGGSGLGITDIQHGSIDIGASDAPMTPSQYAGDTSGTPVQIPDLLSATGVGYNIRGVGFGLHLTGPILAQIYNGKITTWGNSSITKINKPF